MDRGQWTQLPSKQNLCWVDLPGPYIEDRYATRKYKMTGGAGGRNMQTIMSQYNPEFGYKVDIQKKMQQKKALQDFKEQLRSQQFVSKSMTINKDKNIQLRFYPVSTTEFEEPAE